MGKTLQRTLVAAAFRKMAHGVDRKTAFATTVAFYRSPGKVLFR
jgi:hypothetical protein